MCGRDELGKLFWNPKRVSTIVVNLGGLPSRKAVIQEGAADPH